MAAFIIPTIFTAINRFSGPANQVAQSMQNVAASAGRAQVGFANFSPLLDNTTTRLLQFARSAILVGGVIAGITFSAKSIIDYDKALAKFRIVVDDLSNADFSRFEDGIKGVAKATQSSMVDVANAFEAIAQISPEFAKTPALIDAVAKSAITLSRASGLGLKESSESVATIMNQNQILAEDSERVINVLAASQAIGAASINQLAQSYKNFGSIGVGANITLERSNALFQVLARNGIAEAEAGTKARRLVIDLQQAGVGYKSGKFDLLEGLSTVKSRLDTLGSPLAKDAYLLKLFGEQGKLTGMTLVDNIALFQQYEKQVTGTNEANVQAAITTGTMSFKLDALKNSFQNYIITSTTAKIFTFAFGGVVSFLTNNMTALGVAATVILGPLLLFKGALMAISLTARIAAFQASSLAFAQGFLQAAMGVSAMSIRGNAAALRGYTAMATLARNSALLLNVAIGATGLALVGFLAYAVTSEHAAYELAASNDTASASYKKLGLAITSAEVALLGYQQLKGKYTERENLEREYDFERKRGGVYGNIAAAWIRAKLTNIMSPYNKASLDIEANNLGLTKQLADPNSGRAYVDSLNDAIKMQQDRAVDSANAANGNAIQQYKSSTSVAAPIVYNNITVDGRGGVSITNDTVSGKPVQKTGAWGQ